jgi:hypothetical protein
LTFFKPNFSEAEQQRFYGGVFSARFPKWLIHNVSNVPTLVCMWEQMLGIEATRKVLSALARDNRIGFSMNFLQKLCTTLSITFGKVHSHAKKECELKTWVTRELPFDFGHHVQMRRVFNKLLRTQNRSIFLASFLTTSLFPLHRLYSIFTEGSAADRWNVIALHDGSSFYVIYQPMYTMNFMLKPSHAF